MEPAVATPDQQVTPTREELLAEIRRRGRRRSFDEILGPEPEPGTEHELADFIAWLEALRRVPHQG
jgi:hypothetical protein